MLKEIILSFFATFNLPPMIVKVQFKEDKDLPKIYTDPYRKDRAADGYCKPKYDKNYNFVPGGLIIINKQLWQHLNKWERLELMFHEMGHCYLNLRHVTGKNHIMNPFAPYRFWAKADGSNWQELVDKMIKYYKSKKI